MASKKRGGLLTEKQIERVITALEYIIERYADGKQTKAGELLGMGQPQISAILLRDRNPGFESTAKIARFLHMTTEELINVGVTEVDQLVREYPNRWSRGNVILVRDWLRDGLIHPSTVEAKLDRLEKLVQEILRPNSTKH